MKFAPIAVGLLATASLASPAFARGGVLHLLDAARNPEHIRGLPAEVRNALAHITVRVALSLAACIKFIHQRAAVIGC